MFIKGNILDSKCMALINPVNTYGVMGSGLALDFKNEYPGMYTRYKQACKQGEVKMHVWISTSWEYIICFPTKTNWIYPSKIEYIIEGLKDLKEVVDKYSIKSIALPALGWLWTTVMERYKTFIRKNGLTKLVP